MSKPRAGRGRSVSPSHTKRGSQRSKSIKKSSGRGSNNKETATEKTRARSKSRHRDERSNRGRSKSVHNRTRSRSKSVHQKSSSSRKKESSSTKARSRSKSVHRKHPKNSSSSSKRRSDPQHQQQYSEDDYSDAEEPRQAAAAAAPINRRGSLVRQPSGIRMRRSKSMSLGVNNPLEPDDEGKSRRARRRMSSFGNASGDEGGPGGVGGRPTLSKELQKRRSVRRLQVEEIKSQERLQNSIFEKALQRNKSSRVLSLDDSHDDDETDNHPTASRRAGRRSTMGHSSALSDERSARGGPRSSSNRRGSLDLRSASMKRSSSRRGLSLSDDDDEPIRSRRGNRRTSMEHNVASWKRVSSSRRLVADDIGAEDTHGNNTRRKNRTTVRRSKSNTMESDRPTPPSMKRATSCDGAEDFEPLQRISRSNRRASMDVAVKKASSSRRISMAASKIDPDDPPHDDNDSKDKPNKEEVMNFFGDFESDEDFFKAGAGIKAISIEGGMEDKDTEKAFKVLAKAESAACMMRAASGRKLVEPESEEEPEHSASEQEESMTEMTEDQSELLMTDMSESMAEAVPPRRMLASKADSKNRIGLQKAASARRSLRQMMESEDTDLETDDDEVTISSRLPPKMDSKSAFLQKAAQGKALLDMAKSSKKYNLEDSSVASDLQSQSTADASMRIRRRGSGLGTGPPPRRASGRRTSLGLVKIGRMDESHTTCQSSHTRSTVASSSTNSTLSRSSASHRSSSSAESQAQRMKDFGSRYRSSKQQSS